MKKIIKDYSYTAEELRQIVLATDRDYIEGLGMVGNDGIAFIKLIDNDMESLEKGIFPWLQKELYPDYKKTKKTTRKSPNVIENGKEIIEKTIDFFRFDSNNHSESNNATVSDASVGQHFYCDKNAWYHIEPLISEKNAKSKILEEIKFIQDAYQKGGYTKKDGTWVKCEDPDNKNVIYHF